MKRKFTLSDAKVQVLSRLMKGQAFILPSNEYENMRRDYAQRLEALSWEELFAQYREYTYDIASPKSVRSTP